MVESKMQAWLEKGAKLAWLVDPIAKSVTIDRPGEAAKTLERPEEVVAGAPVEGFKLVCAPLWR